MVETKGAESGFDRAFAVSPAQARARLQEAALAHAREERLRRPGRRSRTFSIDGDAEGFRLSYGFAELRGRLEPAPEGSRLRGRFGLIHSFRIARVAVPAFFVFLYQGPIRSGGAYGVWLLVGLAAMVLWAFVQVPRLAARQGEKARRWIGDVLPDATSDGNHTTG